MLEIKKNCGFFPAMKNRRQFLRDCSVLTLAAGFAPAAGYSQLRPTPKTALSQLRFEDFSAQVGASFMVTHPSAVPVKLQLVEASITPSVHPFAHRAGDARNEKFSLLFRGPKAAVLPQDTYQFEHSETGRFELFIVPVGGRDSGWICYQAVFNRPVQEPTT